MKNRRYFDVLATATVLALCWQLTNRVSAQTATNAPDLASPKTQYQQVLDHSQRVLDDTDAQSKQAEELLAQQEARAKQYTKLLAEQEVRTKRADELLDRQAKDLDRYEKILATWENQQRQYQSYLDSLGKK